MVLNFAKESGSCYSIKCVNQSTANWYIYLYQRLPGQSASGIYSLVWMISPYKIGPDAFITFMWSPDYSFWWLNTGILKDGALAAMAGYANAQLTTNNSTVFNITDNTPGFSTPVPGQPADHFMILNGGTIPNSVFSTGTGMSGFPVLAGQAYINTVQESGTGTTFWVAATTIQKQAMQAISQDTISNSQQFTFPLNRYSLTATLGEDNSWTIL